MIGLGILIMAIAIGTSTMPSEILDFWFGYFKALWRNIKYLCSLIFKKRK